MQKAEIVLSLLSQKSAQKQGVCVRQTVSEFVQPDFYLLAYSNIYAQRGKHDGRNGRERPSTVSTSTR